MAVNQNHSEDRREALIPHGESVLKKCSDVDFSFPQPPPGSNFFRGTKRGVLFLTSYRVIFVTSRSLNDPMLSFMMPFHLMSNCTVEQPILGANYIKGTIQAAPDGGWEGSATFKMVFRKGGAIDFAQLMAKAAYAVAYGVPPAGHGAPPPSYNVLPPGYGARGYGSPPPVYGATPVGYGVPPPGYEAPTMVYGAPPPGYGAPPPGYGAPPPGYGAPPPSYETTAVGSGSSPPRYEAPPMSYETPPSGYRFIPPVSGAPPAAHEAPPAAYEASPAAQEASPAAHEAPPAAQEASPAAHEAPPAGSEAGHPVSAAAQTPGFQASFPATSSSQARSPPSKM